MEQDEKRHKAQEKVIMERANRREAGQRLRLVDKGPEKQRKYQQHKSRFTKSAKQKKKAA